MTKEQTSPPFVANTIYWRADIPSRPPWTWRQVEKYGDDSNARKLFSTQQVKHSTGIKGPKYWSFPQAKMLETLVLKNFMGVLYCVYHSLIKTRSPSTSTNYFVIFQKVTKERYWFIYWEQFYPSLEKSDWVCSRLVWQSLSPRTSNIATLTILSAILERIALFFVHQGAVGHTYRSKVFWLLKTSQP